MYTKQEVYGKSLLNMDGKISSFESHAISLFSPEELTMNFWFPLNPLGSHFSKLLNIILVYNGKKLYNPQLDDNYDDINIYNTLKDIQMLPIYLE
jgi:hypothetical protein